MDKIEFEEFIKTENFNKLEDVHRVFDPFVEDDTLEEYIYDYYPGRVDLNITVVFANGETYIIKVLLGGK